ncbi:polyketide synthase dehydratase domain-containing protein, partial [Frankia canadensis]|uniref:polyketide synthase dehydratase domain-containing protein n=1 Tax=Frankia canadensis TaxID=1836972 RepID=UPI000E1F345B
PDTPWTTHATGTLTPAEDASAAPSTVVSTAPDLRVWPPPRAVPAPVEDLYPRLSQIGLNYGPAFRGVRRAWLRGEEVFVEVELPEELAADARRFAVHPALLDAALHGLALRGFFDGTDGGPRLPFSWSGVRLHATGAQALRVRLAPNGPDAMTVQAADQDGNPVVDVDALVVRPVPLEQLRAAAQACGEDLLLRVNWEPLAPNATAAPTRWALVGDDDPTLRSAWDAAGVKVSAFPDVRALGDAIASGTPAVDEVALSLRPVSADPADPTLVPTAVGATAERLLELLQSWLRDERLAQTRLVLITHGAVVTGDDPAGGPDLVAAPVWGMVRSAQREGAGRFVLVDVDTQPASLRLVPAAVATDEEQIAIRAGRARVPRLAKAASPAATPAARTSPRPLFDPEGTVLITGGTGTLGTLLARHLVHHHGVRHLHLTSRQGPHAPGATHLTHELTHAGAHITITATDTTNPHHLTTLLTT